ncbi:MAG: hypothetical protein HZC52_09605 [Planctomycetes bacterium]|nr:hypothetical protein [Planctomycetota bacterium]
MLEYYQSALISLFARVQELNSNPTDLALCQNIQEKLIQRITYVERRIRTLKDEIAKSKKRLKTTQPVRLSKIESTGTKEAIQYKHHLLDEYRLLLSILNAVGDAIVFTYIDKWDIKPMAFKEPAGFISGKKGTRLERRIFRGAFGLGQIAILNDLTTCLRYGDITVPRFGKALIIEVKSSKKRNTNDRTERQEIGMNKIGNYLATDRTEGLYGKEGAFVRISFQREERHHRDRLNVILAEALKNGFSYEEVEEGLHYYAATRFDELSLNEVVKRCDGKPLFQYVDFIDNTGYFPLTLSIRDPAALYKFYRGGLTLLVFIKPKTIEQKCKDKGFTAEILFDEEWAIKLVNPKLIPYDDGAIRIGRHIFGRIFGEFLSLDWFLNEMMDRSIIDHSTLVGAETV